MEERNRNPNATALTGVQSRSLWLAWLSKSKTLSIATVTAVAVAGCGGTSTNAPQDKTPIVIAVSLVNSGSLATFGQQILPAINLAVKQINDKGGIKGRPLQVQVADDLATGAGAVAAAQRLLTYKPVALLGHVISPAVPPVLPILEKAQVPCLCGGSTDSLGANVGGPGSSDWYFKVTVNTGSVVPAEVRYAKAHFDTTRVGISATDDNIGHTFADSVTSELKQLGAPAPVVTVFNCTTCTDYTAQIEALKAKNVTVTFTAANAPQIAGFLRGSAQLGLKVPKVMIQSASYATFYDKLVSPSLMDGNLTVMDSLPTVDSKDPVMAAFSKAYKQASGQDATQIVPEWYATVFWLASVIEKVGTNGDAIRKGLADTKSFTQWQSFKMPGIKFSCDSHHYCNTHMYLITGVNGQPTIVGEYEGGTKT